MLVAEGEDEAGEEHHEARGEDVGADGADVVPAGKGVGIVAIRRGMPASRRKRCRKKIMFAPMKASQKCSLPSVLDQIKI
jgi:hypothetical protein